MSLWTSRRSSRRYPQGSAADRRVAEPEVMHVNDMPAGPVYLDNAATTFPKPSSPLEKAIETYRRIGVSPGRGGYDLAAEAEEFVRETRRKTARFFGSSAPDRVIFTGNATDALNIALQGLLRPGDHVVSTRLERTIPS